MASVASLVTDFVTPLVEAGEEVDEEIVEYIASMAVEEGVDQESFAEIITGFFPGFEDEASKDERLAALIHAVGQIQQVSSQAEAQAAQSLKEQQLVESARQQSLKFERDKAVAKTSASASKPNASDALSKADAADQKDAAASRRASRQSDVEILIGICPTLERACAEYVLASHGPDVQTATEYVLEHVMCATTEGLEALSLATQRWKEDRERAIESSKTDEKVG